jgi:hypothetical protein
MSYHADQTPGATKLYPLSVVEEQPASLVPSRGGWDLKTILLLVVGVALLWHLWKRSQSTQPNEATRVPGVRIVSRVRDRLRSGEYLTAKEMRTLADQLTSFLRMAGSE